jgi:hypothetical protein
MNPALQPNNQPNKYAIIGPLKIFVVVGILGIGQSADRQYSFTTIKRKISARKKIMYGLHQYWRQT